LVLLQLFIINSKVFSAGCHKLNTAVAQAYYNKKEGVKKLSTKPVQGKWGSALALAGNFFWY
jgi:predicted alternative tryptophan synthase beta-subunit